MAQVDALIVQRAQHALQVLSRYTRIAGAYIFGSQVEGNIDQWSDIDLAVFMDDLDQWDLRVRAQTAATVMMEVGNDIELHFFSSESLTHPEPASFASYILAHGVPIYP